VCSKCREKASKPKKICGACGDEFIPKRVSARFCSQACGARDRRRRAREQNPLSGVRTFLCSGCGQRWSSKEKGNPRSCPTCREARDVAGRTKTCAYRECGQEFVDTSSKNSMSYCHPEHRRREKQFRSGRVSCVGQFRKCDPVLAKD
jgi:hypothetical protein